MNDANKKSEAELNQLCQAFLFNLQFIKAPRFRSGTLFFHILSVMPAKVEPSTNICV